jgi:hypothetical protein
MEKCNCISKIRVYNITVNNIVKSTSNSLIEAEAVKELFQNIGVYHNIEIVALDICKNCLKETIVK